MKFIWKGKWRNGEIIIEAETLQELEDVLKNIHTKSEVQGGSEAGEYGVPVLPHVVGCSEAVRKLMETSWWKEPKSMSEIRKSLEANALYFSKGTLSGILTMMVKRGELKRFKEDGRWKYLVK
jgi:hypothetical protein